MRKSIRLSVAATVYMLIFLSSQGMAMSQERSRVIDTGVIFSAQQVERSPNVDWVKTMGVTPPFWTPSLEDIALSAFRVLLPSRIVSKGKRCHEETHALQQSS